MKITISFRRNDPNTVEANSLDITYHYSGTKEEIDNLHNYCKTRVDSGLVIDTDDMSSQDLYKI